VTASSEARRRDGGFSLIEVLIAMVILAVGLLGLEAMGVSAGKLSARADRRSLYAVAATDAMEKMLGTLREGNGAAGTTTFTVKNAAGTSLADGSVIVASGGSTTSPALTRWDVTVRVIPKSSADLADSVNVSSSVIQ
jgi:type IV pilus assembly protein PilV